MNLEDEVPELPDLVKNENKDTIQRTGLADQAVISKCLTGVLFAGINKLDDRCSLLRIVG